MLRSASLIGSLVLATSHAEEIESKEATEFTCFEYGSGDDETSLKLKTTTIYNEDQDKNYWRIQFIYKGLIQEDDTVSMYLSFTPTSLFGSIPVETIAEDTGYCRMTNRADNTVFWDVEALDLYAKCTADDGDDNACANTDPETYISTTESTSENNWTVPIEDDDNDNRFCTRPEDYLEDQTYACQQITCYIQRLFDTGDESKDLVLMDPDNNDDDSSVTVRQNRCWVQIGSSNAFTSSGPKDAATKTIKVNKNALYGASMSFASLVAFVATMLSF